MVAATIFDLVIFKIDVKIFMWALGSPQPSAVKVLVEDDVLNQGLERNYGEFRSNKFPNFGYLRRKNPGDLL